MSLHSLSLAILQYLWDSLRSSVSLRSLLWPSDSTYGTRYALLCRFAPFLGPLTVLLGLATLVCVASLPSLAILQYLWVPLRSFVLLRSLPWPSDSTFGTRYACVFRFAPFLSHLTILMGLAALVCVVLLPSLAI